MINMNSLHLPELCLTYLILPLKLPHRTDSGSSILAPVTSQLTWTSTLFEEIRQDLAHEG